MNIDGKSRVRITASAHRVLRVLPCQSTDTTLHSPGQNKGTCLFPWLDISEIPAARFCLYIGRSSPRQVQDAEQSSAPLLCTNTHQHMACGWKEVKKNISHNLGGLMKLSPKRNLLWNKEEVINDKEAVEVLVICTGNLQQTTCPLFFKSFYVYD